MLWHINTVILYTVFEPEYTEEELYQREEPEEAQSIYVVYVFYSYTK